MFSTQLRNRPRPLMLGPAGVSLVPSPAERLKDLTWGLSGGRARNPRRKFAARTCAHRRKSRSSRRSARKWESPGPVELNYNPPGRLTRGRGLAIAGLALSPFPLPPL